MFHEIVEYNIKKKSKFIVATIMIGFRKSLFRNIKYKKIIGSEKFYLYCKLYITADKDASNPLSQPIVNVIKVKI